MVVNEVKGGVQVAHAAARDIPVRRPSGPNFIVRGHALGGGAGQGPFQWRPNGAPASLADARGEH